MPTDRPLSPAEELDPPRRRSPIGGHVRSGIRWKLLSGVTVQLTRTLTAITIARLITPDEFGLAALAIVFSSLATSMTDLSLGAALVQRASISEADRSTAFWTSAGVGFAMTLGFVGLSFPVAWFYGEPDVQPLLMVYSLTFLLNGLSTTQATLLTRDLQFRSLELRVIVATLLSAPVAIVFAALGAGAWAIIAQSLTFATVSLPLLWIASSWRPSFLYSRRSLHDLGRFGLNVLGAQIARFATTSADTILVGRFLGSASVGAYSLAFNLTMFPLARIVTPLQNITFPAFSRMQDDRASLASGWLRAISLVTLVVAPATLGLVVVAPVFVPVVLGSKWHEAVPVMQALAVVALLLSIQRIGFGSALLALDRSGTYFRFTVVASAANVLAFVAGLPWGITGVAIAYAGMTTLLTAASMFVAARAVGSSLRAYADHVLPPLAAAGIMASGVLALRLVLPDGRATSPLGLLLLCIAGVVIYVPLAAWFAPGTVAELRRLLPSR